MLDKDAVLMLVEQVAMERTGETHSPSAFTRADILEALERYEAATAHIAATELSTGVTPSDPFRQSLERVLFEKVGGDSSTAHCIRGVAREIAEIAYARAGG